MEVLDKLGIAHGLRNRVRPLRKDCIGPLPWRGESRTVWSIPRVKMRCHASADESKPHEQKSMSLSSTDGGLLTPRCRALRLLPVGANHVGDRLCYQPCYQEQRHE